MPYMGINISHVLAHLEEEAEQLRKAANLPSAVVYLKNGNVRVQTRAHADGKIVHTITVEKTST